MNVSIKIYFRLNTLRLCKNLIRTVDSRQVCTPGSLRLLLPAVAACPPLYIACLLLTWLPPSSPAQFADFDAFPASQRVTYKFYVGRLAVFDENYVRRRRLAAGTSAHGCVSARCLPTLVLLPPI